MWFFKVELQRRQGANAQLVSYLCLSNKRLGDSGEL